MTTCSLGHTPSGPPELVELAEYGICGGILGRPVSIAFRDVPPDLTAGLWGYLAAGIPSEQVLEVWSQSDVRRLNARIGNIRLVLVYPSNGRGPFTNTVDWMIERRRGIQHPLPAVLSNFDSRTGDTPNSTLLVTGSAGCNDGLMAWLKEQEQFPGPRTIESVPEISSTCLMRALRESCRSDSPLSVRDTKIVEGLTLGAALVDAQSRCSNTRSKKAEVSPSHYAVVRDLLQKPFLQSINEPHDELTCAMVARANLQLSLCAKGTPPNTKPVGARAGTTSTTQTDNSCPKPPVRMITRCCLSDLGNPCSNTLKNLVKQFVKRGGSEDVELLGISEETFQEIRRRSRSTKLEEELMKRIPCWSYKQVRTRFENLRREGLIEVSRSAKNGSLEYRIPEELAEQRSPFEHLPAVEEVERFI